MSDFLRLLQLMRPYWGWLVLSAFLASVTVLANAALLGTSGWFITAMGLAGVAGVSMNYFTPAAMIRGFAILRTVSRYAERVISHEATLRVLAGLRVWLYKKLEPLAPGALATNRAADLSTRLQGDVDRLEQVFLRFISPIAVALFCGIVLVAFTALWSLDFAIALALLLILSGLVLPLAVERYGRDDARQVARGSVETNIALTDTVEGLADLQSYGAFDQAKRRGHEVADTVVFANWRLARNSAVATAGIGLAAQLAVIAALLILIPLFERGALSGPDLVMLTLLAIAAFEAVMPMPAALLTLSATLASARRIFALADTEPVVKEPARPVPLPVDMTFQFNDVSFSYPGQERAAVRNADLTLAPRRRIGVLGPSGSGKSTLGALALRFFDPTSGSVLLGGVNIRDLSADELRSHIAVASQTDHFFTATIRDNLRIARPTAAPEEIEDACRMAQIHDFIVAQPDGYDTFVGAAGLKLSGGQLRRLTVARAILKDAPILILDEPTEGLDGTVADALLAAVLTGLPDKSILLITHYPVRPELLDEMIVMEDGAIVERRMPPQSSTPDTE